MGPPDSGGSPPASRLKLSELLSFLPKQWTAWRAAFTHLYVLFGGARGPGKSRWLRWTLLSLLLYWFLRFKLRGVRVGLFCETYPDLQDRQISKIALEFPLWLGEVKDTEIDGLAFFVRPEYGGGILCLRNLDKPEKYQSAEFAAIGVDELTKNTREKFDLLRGSLRWPGIEHTPFLAATNPGGIGHAWVKQLWLDRQFPAELRSRARHFIFIPALPKDNPFLTANYWEELNSLAPRLKRAWVDGDWSAFEGQSFPGWAETTHGIRPFEIPAHWTKWRAVDWGFAAPFCCLWLAKDPDRGRIFVYRELYAPGMTDRQQAKAIIDLTVELGVSLTFADPSMWAKKNVANVVTSTADEYAAEGIALTKADNDRISGKRKVDRLLASLPDGLPGLQVFRTCPNLANQLSELASDPSNPEDVAPGQEDHAYDGIRYALTNVRPSGPPAKAERVDTRLPREVEALL